MDIVKVKNLEIANDKPFVLIAGPCAMESLEHALDSIKTLKEITDKLNIPFIFKSSFDKANRTSISSKRGVGLEKGIEMFTEVKKQYPDTPILTDVHSPEQCEKLKDVVDVLQIPAFLCRQTDLLVAAAKTGLAINVKKGQFLSPAEMTNVIEKVKSTGNNNVMACERGTSFGYNTLINDFKGVASIVKTGVPLVFDATHSCQQPGGNGKTTAGQREFAEMLARCAISVGVASVFIETHKNPEQAISDGPNMIPMDQMEKVLTNLKAFDDLAKK